MTGLKIPDPGEIMTTVKDLGGTPRGVSHRN